MKKTVIIFLIALGAWSYYIKNGGFINFKSDSFDDDQSVLSQNNSSKFKCDGRQHCSQMSSYEEAVFFYNNCPDTKMDGDHDGIPCERQFGR